MPLKSFERTVLVAKGHTFLSSFGLTSSLFLGGLLPVESSVVLPKSVFDAQGKNVR